MMSFLELQAAGSKVQMYTKVAEAVDFFASVGADVNLSIMGKGAGWREATAEEISQMTPEQKEAATLNGKVYMLEFSDVTGMPFYGDEKTGRKGAVDYKNKYDNVQMILVGMNDTHIRLAMKNSDIDFIIPWHSSGNSKEVLSNLISAVGEKLNTSVDYTTTQSDMKKGETKHYYDENGDKVEYSAPGEQTAEEKQLWDLRMRILTGKANNTEAKGGFTADERTLVYNDPWLRQLYDRFYVKGVDDACFGVKLSGKQAGQIFPYEYWDTSLTKDQADENGRRFVEYCERMGIIPRFSQFKDDPGYWKLLIDRPMYNNDGTYHEQQTINVTNARIGQLDESGKLDRSTTDLPTQAQAVYAPKDKRSPMYEEYKMREDNAVMAAEEALGIPYTEKQTEAMDDAQAIQTTDDVYSDGVDPSLSIYGEENEGDLDLTNDAASDYQDAVARGDMEAAQEDVDFYAEQKGYTEEVFHGTRSKFNSFDIDKAAFGNSGYGFYFGDQSRAAAFGGEDMNLIHAYINPDRIGTPESHNITAEQFENAIQRLGLSPNKTYGEYVNTAEEYVSLRNDWRLAYDLQDWAHWPQWSTESGSQERMPAKEILSILQETLGMDGIRNDNEIVLWDNRLIKSADPVTYDDNGNVIPLDQRFSDSPDIRYSTGGETNEADQELNQTLVNSGALTQEEIDAYNEKTSRPLEGKSRKWMQSEGPAQRQFGGEEGMLQESDEFDQRVIDFVRENNAYFPDTNEGQIKRALNWVRGQKTQTPDGKTTDGYAEALKKVTGKSFDYRSADGQARMVAVMGLAAARNDVTAQVMLADAFNRQGTDLGRTLQSRKLFKLMTPAGRISLLQKMMEDQKDILGKQGKNIELKFSDWLIQAAAMAESDEDFRKVQAAAASELGEQIPANWKDRLRELRMLSMLANPRTHIRNIIGNALFVPAVSLKNKLGAVGEITRSALSSKERERTKTLSLASSKEVRAFARQDAENIRGLLTGEAKYSEATQIAKSQNKLGKALDWASEKNSNALEGEDWFFLKGHYRRALGGWMTANGYTVEQVQNDAALLERGRQYAINEAQKATYRDFNKAAAALNEVSRKGGVTGFIVDAALPFKKTPANILRRGIEYSPVGIVKSLTVDMYRMKQYMDYENGKLKVMPEKAMSPNQVIDDICSGLSGTAIMALGFLLAGTGAVTCGLDDDEDKFDKAKGEQEYAIKLFGMDVSYTMDWAAPMSMPFFVGAAIRNQAQQEDDVNVEKILNSIGSMTEPVFNLSMLDGINTLFKTSSYDTNTNPITQIGSKIATNYISSYVPSVLGAINRTFFDDKQRKSFVESGKSSGVAGQFRYMLEQIQNKIPGLAQQNIAARDIWGNEKTTGFMERLFENFISPGYIEHVEDDPIINEMARLYELNPNDYSSMIPKEDPAKTISYTKDKETHKVVLTDKQWDHYKEVRNKTAHAELTELINSDEYKAAVDSVQVKMINDVWSHADKVGQHAVVPEVEVKDKNVAEVSRDARISGINDEIVKALKAEDYDAYDTMVEAMNQEFDDPEDAKKEIMKKVGDTYRDQWKAAYRNGDSDRMGEIENLLEYTGFSFNIYGKRGWMAQVDDEAEKKESSALPQARYSASTGVSDAGSRKHYEGMDDYRGNIDIDHRPVLYNDDGTISTEESFSVGIDGKEVLLPTIINGKRVSEQEAINHYYETGDHLGIFDTPEEAEEYAERLHNRQDWYYHR